jgi:hypothetical protein
MKLFDVKHGHAVATITGDEITDRWGRKFLIDGYAVENSDGEFVGSFVDGTFSNIHGQFMAAAKGCAA